jgi:hypothetical protein
MTEGTGLKVKSGQLSHKTGLWSRVAPIAFANAGEFVAICAISTKVLSMESPIITETNLSDGNDFSPLHFPDSQRRSIVQIALIDDFDRPTQPGSCCPESVHHSHSEVGAVNSARR